MVGRFNLEDYEPVEDRLRRFWDEHPQGRVSTSLVFRDEKRVLIEARVFRDKDDVNPKATGFAEEVVGSTPVNRTSAVENCETSAIGRALANANFASMSRASREEMQKVNRHETSPGSEPSANDPAVARAKDALYSLVVDNNLDAKKVGAEFQRVTQESLNASANLARINKFATWLLNNMEGFEKTEGDAGE